MKRPNVRRLTTRRLQTDSRSIERVGVKRSRYATFSIADQNALDLNLLFKGKWQVDELPTIRAFSPLSGETTELQHGDIEFLGTLGSSDYVTVRELIGEGRVDDSTVMRLIDAGLIVSNSEISPDAELRAREEQLDAVGWHPAALEYHFASKWDATDPIEGVDRATDPDGTGVDRYQVLVDAYGEPPSHFFSIETTNSTDLPEVDNSGDLFDLLEKRRTVRIFDTTEALPLKNLSAVLYYVCGCMGRMRLSDSLVALKKSSPSGGALHPTETFVLAADVDSLEPGFYHYNVESHRLDRISTMPTEKAREIAVELSAGQDYLASAPVLLLFVSRYDRLFWKYRNHKKAYKVSLLDAAHLSQTFYLVCEALGLGAFFTAAICDSIIEENLNLDTAMQGVAGVCAFGVPSEDGRDFELQPTAYKPGSGEI